MEDFSLLPYPDRHWGPHSFLFSEKLGCFPMDRTARSWS